MDKQMMWILVVVALFIGLFGGYAYEKSKLTNQMMMAETAMQKQIDDLKMKNDQLMVSPTPAIDMMLKTSPEPSGMMKQTTITPKGAMMEK